MTRPASCHFPFTLLPSPAHLPKSKCQHACKQNFQLNELMVWSSLYHHYYFLADPVLFGTNTKYLTAARNAAPVKLPAFRDQERQNKHGRGRNNETKNERREGNKWRDVLRCHDGRVGGAGRSVGPVCGGSSLVMYSWPQCRLRLSLK